MIKAADETEPREVARNMHLALPVIFRILYGCGLRVSEVVGLRYKDVNLEDGILTIREAKTDRDRYIPLSDSVKEACIGSWERLNLFCFPAPKVEQARPEKMKCHRFVTFGAEFSRNFLWLMTFL